jgi:hypothetical protein
VRQSLPSTTPRDVDRDLVRRFLAVFKIDLRKIIAEKVSDKSRN